MAPSLTVFLMDVWSVVPYYTGPLYKGLARENLRVTLCSMTYDLDPDCFAREGIRNDPGLLDLVGKRRLRNRTLRRILKFAEGSLNLLALGIRFLAARPAVIHVHQVHFGRGLQFEKWFLYYAKAIKIKLVYTVHNLLPHDSGEKHRPALSRLYRMVDGLICHSESVKQQLVEQFGVDGRKIWVIPHGPLFQNAGVRQGKKTCSNSGECLVVCQGMIRPYKGIPFLLEAWREVEASGCSARLIIAGLADPSYAEDLRQHSARLNLKSVIFDFRFLTLEEMLDLLRSADVLAYPYREITTSGALMTGVVQRKAVVATDLAPFRQLLRHEENALLVPYGDVPEMAKAFLRLIGDKEERLRLAAAIGELAGQEDPWTGIASETRRCYESVAAQKILVAETQ